MNVFVITVYWNLVIFNFVSKIAPILKILKRFWRKRAWSAFWDFGLFYCITKHMYAIIRYYLVTESQNVRPTVKEVRLVHLIFYFYSTVIASLILIGKYKRYYIIVLRIELRTSTIQEPTILWLNKYNFRFPQTFMNIMCNTVVCYPIVQIVTPSCLGALSSHNVESRTK